MNSRQKVEKRNLQCEHFDYYDVKDLRRVMSQTARSRRNDRDLFWYTHTPITAHRVDNLAPKEEPEYTETEIYDEIVTGREDNFVTLIEGQTGTGKSELCAALTLRLRDEKDRPILYIEKGDGLLTISTKRIPEFCETYGYEVPSGTRNFEEIEADVENTPQALASQIAGNTIRLLAASYEVDDGKTDGLKEFLVDNLDALVAANEEDIAAKKASVVTTGDYKSTPSIQVFENSWSDTKAADELNGHIWRAIKQAFQAKSLDSLLEELGEQIEDSRPVFAVEDFEIAKSEIEELRNFMERDTSGHGWDFVIAGTTDETELLRQATSEDRFRIYRTNNEGSSQVPYLQEETAVQFIRPYLSYLKRHDGSLTYEDDPVSAECQLQPSPDESICGDCKFCDESFRPLFPFNERVIRRVYRNLANQRPRDFVNRIRESLIEWATGDAQAPSSSREFGGLSTEIRPSQEVYEYSQSLAELASWYGETDNDYIKVDKKWVKAFDILDETAIQDAPVKLVDESFHIPISDTVIVTPVDVDEDEKSEIEEAVATIESNVGPWQENPGSMPYQTCLTAAKFGFTRLFENLTAGFRLAPDTDLAYSLGNEKHVVTFENPEEESSSDDWVVYIDPHDFSQSELVKIMEIGVYVKVADEAETRSVLNSLGTKLTSYAEEWQEHLLEDYLDPNERLFKETGYTLADLGMAGYATLLMIDNPTKELDAELIAEQYAESSKPVLSPDQRKVLDTYLSDEEISALDTLFEHHRELQSLVRWQFGITTNTIDKRRVRQWFKSNTPYEVLSAIGRGQVNALTASIKYSFGESTKLKTVANNLYDVREVLIDLESTVESSDTSEVILSNVNDVSYEPVTEVISNIKKYEELMDEPDLFESLSTLEGLPDDTFESHVAAATLYEELIKGTTQDTIHATLLQLQLESTELVQVLRNLATSTVENIDSIGDSYTEVSQFYVEQ